LCKVESALKRIFWKLILVTNLSGSCAGGRETPPRPPGGGGGREGQGGGWLARKILLLLGLFTRRGNPTQKLFLGRECSTNPGSKDGDAVAGYNLPSMQHLSVTDTKFPCCRATCLEYECLSLPLINNQRRLSQGRRAGGPDNFGIGSNTCLGRSARGGGTSLMEPYSISSIRASWANPFPRLWGSATITCTHTAHYNQFSQGIGEHPLPKKHTAV